MKKNSLTLLLSLLLVAFNYGQFSNKTMDVNGEMRSYRQYLPTGFNVSTEPNLPLIIAMHGIGDNMTNFSNVGFDNIADTARFIVVYPQGMPNILSQNSWNNGTLLASGANDIGFLSMLLDTMKVKYDIDFSRVYFTGFSMGGIMTHHMICALPGRIAAIASVAGPMADSDISSCNPGRAVPVMHMHGTADGTVPYNTGALPSLSLVPTTMAFWQNNNGCGDSSEYNLPNTVSGDNITVDTIAYNSCNAPTILWRENGADHQWLYKPANDIDATTEIWLFFRDKIHPTPSQLNMDGPENYSGIKIQYISSHLEISSMEPIQEIVLYDMMGKVLLETNANNMTTFSCDLSDLSNQIIIVQVRSNGKIINKKVLQHP